MDATIRVLVVDDSAFFAKVVADTLETEHGMEATPASDPEEGLEVLQQSVIDCVVSDYEMGEVDGLAFLAQIRSQGYEQPFILLTGRGSEEVASEAVAAGVTDYFLKQQDGGRYEKLANRIENAVAQRRTEKKYELLVDNSPDLIAHVDEDGTFLAVNPAMAASFDRTRSELVGSSLYDLLPAEVADRRMAVGRRAVDDGEAKTFEDERYGNYFHYIFVPLDAPGERNTFQVIARDITERKRAELKLQETVEKLAESNEQLERFAYVASHDLQEPLRMVSSYVQLLERRYAEDLDEDAREFIEYAVDGASRMKEMIDDLLAYSRVETHGKEFERTDCEAVFDQAVANLSVSIGERDAEVTHDPLPTVEGDESQLIVLLQNLIANGIKYCEERPRVHVSATDEGEEWRFAVADNGIGIDPDHAESVFHIFERLHGRREYSGTGIGLAMCKKIVERHGGDIWVDSAVGEGSTFSFTIPKRVSTDD